MPDVSLLVVDGHALLWRAVFGFPARITSRDKSRDVTGVFGFFSLLRAAVRDELPVAPEVVVVFDGENGVAQRCQADAAYKAHRPVDAAALMPVKSLPDVKRGLDVVGLPWAEIDDAEADDVIAALVRLAGADRDVWIMSGDRDFYQLVTDRVRVVNTAMRPGQRVIGPKEVEARYGVPPHRWCDRVALVGDPADGLPGVRGIGTVTAARLLAGGLGIEDLPGSGRLTGRAGRLVSTPVSLEVSVSGSDTTGIRVELNSATYRADARVTGVAQVQLPLPGGLPPNAWLYLSRDKQWLDYRAIGGYAQAELERTGVEIELPDDPEAEIQALLSQGEGQQVEFKRQLPAGHHRVQADCVQDRRGLRQRIRRQYGVRRREGRGHRLRP